MTDFSFLSTSVITALKTNEEFADTLFWTLPTNPIASLMENFNMAWYDGYMRFYMRNSLLYAGIGSVASAFIASLAAFPIARMRFRGKDLVFYRYATLSTAALMAAIPPIVIFLVLRRFVEKGLIVQGAVKG